MARYTAILFDLFDTLVRFDRARLPPVIVDGREVRSSAGVLYPALAEVFPEVSLAAFYEAFRWSYEEAERRRGADHREVPAPERFGFCYARLGFDPARVPPDLTERLLGLHMACLAAAAEPLPGCAEVLARLAGRHRLGLVSNFDYTPTVHRILERIAIRDRFDAVVVSDAVGWRKPSAAIFHAAFARLGIGPAGALFVGDRPEIDVAGAKGVGMAAAWYNPAGAPYPPGLPEPDFRLARLIDLGTLLGGNRENPLDAPPRLR